MIALDRPAYRWIAMVVLLIAAAGGAYSFAIGRWTEAVAQGALVLLGAAFLVVRHHVPSLFTLLVMFAAAINTAGYVLELWSERTAFDEAVHAFTSFAVSAAIGWLLISDAGMAEGNAAAVALSVIVVGVLLGIAWELFEWAVGMIGGAHDTMIDLVMDTIGAAAAGIFCAAMNRSERGGRSYRAEPARRP